MAGRGYLDQQDEMCLKNKKKGIASEEGESSWKEKDREKSMQMSWHHGPTQVLAGDQVLHLGSRVSSFHRPQLDQDMLSGSFP